MNFARSDLLDTMRGGGLSERVLNDAFGKKPMLYSREIEIK